VARRELVLVACPERELLERLSEEITAGGRRPLLTRDGDAAVRLAIESQPAMAVVDSDLASMNGHLLVSRLRRLPSFRTAPIVLVSADDGVAHLRLGADAGATEVIPRPIGHDEIALRMRRHLTPIRPT